jgi:hypothetical protein
LGKRFEVKEKIETLENPVDVIEKIVTQIKN